MSRATRAILLLLLVCWLCVNAADTATVQPISQRLPTTEAGRRALAIKLRQRIAKGKTTDPAFWRDVKQLEAIGPPDIKIAVVKHPSGTMLYAYKNVNGLALTEGDIVLGPFDLVRAEQALARGDVPPNPAFATVNRRREAWWPNGIVPFEIADDLETRARRAIGDAIADYERFTPVRFRERDGEEQYVRFVKQWHAFGLASMTDSVGANGGKVEVKLQTQKDDDSLKDREIIAASARHEIGHALGMFHEHGRKDRDDFITFDKDCSSYDFWYDISGNYAIEAESEAIGPYDFLSIMHYPSQPGEKGPPWDRKPCLNMVKRSSQRDAGDDTGQLFSNLTLSVHDINAMHHLYGRTGIEGHANDDYGSALLVYNFDPSGAGDRFPDLAVGAPGRDNGNGAVFLYKGTASGLVLWKILTPSTTESGQRFGQTVAAGDFDGNGVQELAVGAPRATVGGKSAAGKVFLFRILGNRTVNETEILTKPDEVNSIEAMDRFGQSLSAGVFFDNDDSEQPVRSHLAIGAPGARDGAQGRVGRVWVMNKDADPKFRNVNITGDPLVKFGQFGFALTVLADRRQGVRHRDLLVVSAPGVTLGGCGSPAVYPTREATGNLQASSPLHSPVTTQASPLCPQDPNLSDAVDSFPSPVWDATYGSDMVSGDFNGDGQSDLAVAESPKVHLYLRNETAQLSFRKSVSNTDFGESTAQPSFGVALAAGDLNRDGRDELLIGAPLTRAQNLQNVGRAYVYKGCVPMRLATGVAPRLPPRAGASGTSALNRLFCFGGLQPWFPAKQTDFQSQDIRVLDPGELAEEMLGIDIDDIEGLREIIGNGSPAFPPFTENHSNDRFGSAIAIMPPVSGFKIRLLIGSSDKALKRRAAAGAVFIFRKSLTNDAPPFRNQSGLTQDFTTSVDRD